MPNFAGLPSGTAAITPENEHLLRSTYEARTEKELPVLVRCLCVLVLVLVWVWFAVRVAWLWLCRHPRG
jgi:hypothetical protein